MDIVSDVVTEKKDSATLPQTRIVRTYTQDAARLEGKSDSITTPVKEPLPSVPETVAVPRPPALPIGEPIIPTPVTPVTENSANLPATENPLTKEPVATVRAFAQPEERKSEMLVFPARREIPQSNSIAEAAQIQKRAGGPSPLHTYQIDFAEHIKKTNASPLSVLAAERDAVRPEMPRETGHPAHTSRYIVLGILLLLLGGGGSYAAYRYLAPEATTLFGTQVTSLIFADEQQEVFGSGATLQSAVLASMADPLSPGAVRILYTSTSTAEAVTQQPVSGKEFIQALDLSAPDILIRNTYPESTFGIIAAGEGAYPFFILKVASFESTFRGMLDWEASIGADLALFYPEHPSTITATETIAEIIVATSTEASTTTSTPAAPIAAIPTFIDRTIANNDVRILLDPEGRSILLYGYRDKTTLIIARDAAAFTEIVQRLGATRQQ